MDYGEILKFLRNEQELKQEDIAKLLLIDTTQYCHYEKENRTIPIKHLNTLSNFYKVSLDYLFDFTKYKFYENEKEEIDKEISSYRLKQFRKEKKLSQVVLAQMLNTSFSTISAYEKQRYVIATTYLYDICKKYNMSADYLLGKIDFIPDWCNK